VINGPRKVISLSDVLTERRSRVEVRPDGVYPIAGVYGFGRGMLLRDAVRGSEISAKHLFRVSKSQIIYSKLKAFEGAFALVPEAADGRFVSNEFPTFDVNQDLALPSFVALFLSSPKTWKSLQEWITGVGARRERLNVKDFLDSEIALPTLEEQRRIVRIVETIETGAYKARQLRENARSFLLALREALLVQNGDWACPEGWTVVSIEEVCDVSLGFTKGRKLTGPTQMLPYLRAINVQDGFISLKDVAEIKASRADLNRFALCRDDVLLLEGGNLEHVGRAWIWDGSISPCLHQNSTIRARVLDQGVCNPQFLAWALGASPARDFCLDEAAATSNVAHLGLAGARAIPVPLPPLDVQQRIIRDLDQVRRQLVRAERKVARYGEMRAHLIDALISDS
jgi:type I restriction enzyme, S subunit